MTEAVHTQPHTAMPPREDSDLRALAQELKALLKEVQWAPHNGMAYCRFCGNGRLAGHTADCRMGLALKGAAS